MVRNKVYNADIRQFEAMLSRHFDNANVLTVCNASIGIMGIFYALGLSGSEVITTPLTWPGAFAGLNMLNCKIKFGTIEEPSLTLNPESIIPLITPQTKAVFTADFLGYPSRLDSIKELCNRHNLILIHDAAGSIGSAYKGFYSGKYADVSVFSLGRNKPFTTGEGGCIVTHSDISFNKIHYHLAHLERQAVASEDINPYALNTSLNVFSVDYGLNQFEKQLSKIAHHQEMVLNRLSNYHKNESYFHDAIPNFYKPFIRAKHYKMLRGSNLPFTPMSADFGISENIFHQYKIINELCYLQ